MTSSSRSWLDSPRVRFVFMVLAVILLNFGLFFILIFFAPFVAGLIVGYIIAKTRDGVVIGLIGSALCYILIFTLTELLTGFSTPIIDIVGAVITMGLIGAVGGWIGSFISSKQRE